MRNSGLLSVATTGLVATSIGLTTGLSLLTKISGTVVVNLPSFGANSSEFSVLSAVSATTDSDKLRTAVAANAAAKTGDKRILFVSFNTSTHQLKLNLSVVKSTVLLEQKLVVKGQLFLCHD